MDTRTKVFLDVMADEEGRVVRVQVFQYGRPVEIGEVSPVVYDPGKPKRARIGVAGVDFDSKSELKVVWRGLFLGVPLFALGVFLWVIA
jgi:hypothetical protein